MATKAPEAKKGEEQFWKDFSTMADYFSPAVSPLQRYLHIDSKEILFNLGVFLGNAAANRVTASSPREMLAELEKVWQEYDIGTLEVADTSPLVLLISDCRVCGQLAGSGEMYECAFHEGFFKGALSSKLGKTVTFRQETNHEGAAGTWCRFLVADTKI